MTDRVPEAGRGAALVTGGARRIGRAVCLTLASAGFDVAVHHHASEDDARDLVAEIEAKGRPAHGAHVVDVTGAGDLFAAGLLHGIVTGRDWLTCARMGNVAAAEIISHIGARPEADLKALFAAEGLL